MRVKAEAFLRGTAIVSALLFSVVSARAEALPTVLSEADLPRLTFQVPAHPVDILEDAERRAEFVKQVREAELKILTSYQIDDRATLRTIHRTMLDAALVLGDRVQGAHEILMLQNLEDKAGAKLTATLEARAWFDSLSAGPAGSVAQKEAYGAQFTALLKPLPWADVAENIHSMASEAEVVSPAILSGAVEAQIKPDAAGTVDLATAERMVTFAAFYVAYFPVQPEERAALTQYVAANDRLRTDIWPGRAAVLPAAAKLSPVAIGIWDSGVDATVYRAAMWAAPASTPKPHTANGVAYDLEFFPSSSQTEPVPADFAARMGEIRENSAGGNDMQAGIDSPAARAFKARLAKSSPADIKALSASGLFYSNYAHGTHVAGISIAGNPAARLVVARFQFDDKLVPTVSTQARAERAARAFADTVAFFKASHVRVVNMSWGYALYDDFERPMQAAGVPEPQRSIEAKKQFEVVRAGLLAAMRSAPDILFVCSAGNSDDDNAFNGAVPSSFDLPNLLTVGAVDQAGETTSFTTSGKNVRVYADGYHVPSHVPGGSVVAWSGTSMASPQVTNLAGKLFALYPDWTVGRVKADILAHAAPLMPGGPPLLNSKATLDDAMRGDRAARSTLQP
jgi:subtilisin family serine protease